MRPVAGALRRKVMLDITDETFEGVLDRSAQVPVIVDLWAPWCGPCRTLGPVLEKVVEESNGRVELVKANVDENPRISATFQVQSIPAVYALKDKKVVDGFIGAIGEAQVREFVERIAPQPTEADALVARGDEASLRQALELEADHEGAVKALAELLVDRGDAEEALAVLARIPENADTRRLAARARVSDAAAVENGQDIERRLNELLSTVKDDEEARQQFVDLLEVLGPDDPRTPEYRRALASRLY